MASRTPLPGRHGFLRSLGRHLGTALSADRDNAPPHGWADELETLACDHCFIKAGIPAPPLVKIGNKSDHEMTLCRKRLCNVIYSHIHGWDPLDM